MNGESAPTVSVVLPAFNAEKFVGEAIESILAQTFTDFELIVIDDGSTDSTLGILRSFDDDRVRVISNPENLGIVKTRNIGIAKARGDYIAVQDADDLSLPTRLGKQVVYLETHPEVALLGSARKTLLPNGAVRAHKLRLQKPTFEDLLKRNCFVHGSVMIRKTALEAVGGYNDLFRFAEDYELYLRIAAKYATANLPEPLYVLRRHSRRTTWKSTPQMMLYRLLAREMALGRVSDEALVRVRSKGIESYYCHLPKDQKIHYHRRLANTYQRNRRRQEALDQYGQLRKLMGFNFANAVKILCLKFAQSRN